MSAHTIHPHGPESRRIQGPDGEPKVVLRLILTEHGDVSVADVQRLLEIANEMARLTFLEEGLAILEQIEISTPDELITRKAFDRVIKKESVPARLESVHKGSWEVSVLVEGAQLLLLLAHPIVQNALSGLAKDALGQTSLGMRMKALLLKSVFGHQSGKRLKDKAAEISQRGNLEVIDVQESDFEVGTPVFTLRWRRKKETYRRESVDEAVEEVDRPRRPKRH